MESQNSNGRTMGVESRGIEVNKTRVRCSELVLRLLALSLTLVAAILLGVDEQTKVVPIPVVSTLPPLYVPVTAKWHHLSAFVYFVVANAIASAYAALSLVLTLATRGGKKGLALMIIVLDLVMVALLFSATGAAAAIGVIAYEGNSQVGWKKVCNVFGKFCHQGTVAFALSLLGSLAFLLLTLLAAAFNLHKKYK